MLGEGAGIDTLWYAVLVDDLDRVKKAIRAIAIMGPFGFWRRRARGLRRAFQ